MALFLYGCWRAAGDALGAAGVIRRSPSGGRGGSGSGGGSAGARRPVNWSGAAAGTRELRHGLPGLRDGWLHGWRQHQHAMAQRRAAQAQQHQTWRQQIAAYNAAIAALNEPPDPEPAEPDPEPGPQAAGAFGVPDPDCRGCGGTGRGPDGERCTSCPGDPEPVGQPPAQQTRSAAPVAAADPPPASPPAGPQEEEDGGPAVTKTTTASKGTGDVQYEQALAFSQAAKTKADAAVNEGDLKAAQQMADELGGVLGDDTKGIDLAVRGAAAIDKVQKANKEMLDIFTALEAHLVKAHGGTHEAIQAAGVAAERQFHGH